MSTHLPAALPWKHSTELESKTFHEEGVATSDFGREGCFLVG